MDCATAPTALHGQLQARTPAQVATSIIPKPNCVQRPTRINSASAKARAVAGSIVPVQRARPRSPRSGMAFPEGLERRVRTRYRSFHVRPRSPFVSRGSKKNAPGPNRRTNRRARSATELTRGPRWSKFMQTRSPTRTASGVRTTTSAAFARWIAPARLSSVDRSAGKLSTRVATTRNPLRIGPTPSARRLRPSSARAIATRSAGSKGSKSRPTISRYEPGESTGRPEMPARGIAGATGVKTTGEGAFDRDAGTPIRRSPRRNALRISPP